MCYVCAVLAAAWSIVWSVCVKLHGLNCPLLISQLGSHSDSAGVGRVCVMRVLSIGSRSVGFSAH